MRLLNHTSKYLAILLLLLITVWAIVFYFAMLDEIYDSLDDGLENQTFLMVQRAVDDPTILTQNDPEFKKHVYNFSPISRKNFQHFEESYRDTLMYSPNDKDYEPARIYESALEYGEDYYKLKVITSMVEADDLVESMILYLAGLYILLIASILLLNNLLLRKIWQPFYNLIAQLRDFRIEKNTALQLQQSNIEEFNLLNTTVDKLIKKSTESYIAQKHFIENASHELQTPLAISINKLELFLENNALSDNQLEDLSTVMDSLSRLTRLNKSLLLLSKIENQQFEDEEEIDFNTLTKTILEDFEDMAIHKKMRFNFTSKNNLRFIMNKDLSIILLTNLIKNALVHGKKNEDIEIEIASNSLQIKNLGKQQALNRQTLFARFEKTSTNKNSTGLGLAIAKAITDKYGLQLNYNYEELHNFKIKFPLKS